MVPTDSCGVTNFQIRQCNNILISLCHRIILDDIYCRLQTLLSEEFSVLSSSDLIIHAVHAQCSLLLPFHLWRLYLFQGCSALKHVQTHTCSFPFVVHLLLRCGWNRDLHLPTCLRSISSPEATAAEHHSISLQSGPVGCRRAPSAATRCSTQASPTIPPLYVKMQSEGIN